MSEVHTLPGFYLAGFFIFGRDGSVLKNTNSRVKLKLKRMVSTCVFGCFLVEKQLSIIQ